MSTPDPQLIAAIKLQIRPIEAEDLHFVLDSWLRSYRKSKKKVRDEVYWPKHQRYIAALSRISSLAIACDESTPGYIIGWACGRVLTDPRAFQAHYVYVKQDYRRNGVARALMTHLGWEPGMPILATHTTHTSDQIALVHNISDDDYSVRLGGEFTKS